jgi:hypothetical protein
MVSLFSRRGLSPGESAPRTGSQKTPLDLAVDRPGRRQGGPHHRLPGRSAAERRPAPVGRRRAAERAEISSRAQPLCSPRALLHSATESAVRQDAGRPPGEDPRGVPPARICPWYGKVSHLSPARREVLRLHEKELPTRSSTRPPGRLTCSRQTPGQVPARAVRSGNSPPPAESALSPYARSGLLVGRTGCQT